MKAVGEKVSGCYKTSKLKRKLKRVNFFVFQGQKSNALKEIKDYDRERK